MALAAILGILASLVGPAIELGKCLAEPAKRHFSYLCCFHSNVKSLKDEAEKLKNEKEQLEIRVDLEKRNAQVIISDIYDWLKHTDQIQDKRSKLESEISMVQGGCLAIKSRFLLSKKAKKIAEATKELREKCSKLDPISMAPPPLASVEPNVVGHVHEFPSRKQVEEDVMKALKERQVNMIGIYGMGGIGKTTLAKKLKDRVKRENLFDYTLMVNVGQQIDMVNIQQQMAESLGLKLEERELETRAYKLRMTLTQSNKRTLIVVDDVWATLELNDLGIPCDNGIIILLTSRSKDVLNQMSAEVFALKILSEDEAWSLFKDKVGSYVDDPDLHSIAVQVANECNGLPIALVALGSALKGKKDIHIWNDTLRKLECGELEKISREIDHKVCIPLKLSYDYLENRDAKDLFLLCSQFPEDYEIDVNNLTMHCMALRLFGERSNVKQTRDGIFTIVDMLKSRSLLLDGPNKNFVKMHDLVRDMAIGIASQEGLANCYPKSPADSDCKWKWKLMFPDTANELHDLQVGSSNSSLNVLAIHNNNWNLREPLEIKSVPFFEGMKELKSLSLRNVSFEPLLLTIQSLQKLRTLCLDRLNLERISVIGELLRLEILMCKFCKKIKEVPIEIGQLKHLKLLDFEGCRKLTKIAPGVISSLVELEELKLRNSFRQWESTNIKEDERSNASLDELQRLTKLTLLWIEIRDVSLVEEGIQLPSRIVNYIIRFGGEGTDWADHFGKALIIDGIKQNINCANWICQLLRTTEELHLQGDVPRNFDLSILNHIKHLELDRLPNLKEIHVPKGSVPFKSLNNLNLRRLPMLTSLWKIPNQNDSPNNLTKIYLQGCDKLQNLFYLVGGTHVFLQLEELYIESCETMEGVFYNDGVNVDSIRFSKLKKLELKDLPSLTTFCKGFEYIKLPLLHEVQILDCPKLTRFVTSGETEGSPNDDLFELLNNQKVALGSLEVLVIQGYLFRCLYSSPMIKDFVNVKRLKIENCIEMERVTANEVSLEMFSSIESLQLHNLPKLEQICDTPIFSGGSNAFNNLKMLSLVNLPALEHLWNSPNQPISLPNLSELTISWCGNILCSWIMSTDLLLQLELLRVQSCEIMGYIFSNEQNGNLSHLTFKKLKKLELEYLRNIVTFCDGVESIGFPMLEEVSIRHCPNLVSLVSLSGCNQNDGTDEEHNECIHLFCCEKVTFGRLTILHVSGYNCRRMWCPQIPPDFFRELERLSIWFCDEIRSLFSFSTVKNLVNLKSLHISCCQKMEKVIGDEMKSVESSQIPVFFPRLMKLRLWGLAWLRSFCEWSCALNLPLLGYVCINKCPEMECLSWGSLNTPTLDSIYWNAQRLNIEELNRVDGLNGFIRQQRK